VITRQGIVPALISEWSAIDRLLTSLAPPQWAMPAAGVTPATGRRCWRGRLSVAVITLAGQGALAWVRYQAMVAATAAASGVPVPPNVASYLVVSRMNGSSNS
jgi:hypothetical protein